MLLVTGGAGYIGSHFVNAYLKRYPSSSIVVVDDLSVGNKESLPDSPNVHLHIVGINNKSEIAKILRDYSIDTVVHFAASAYVGESEQEPIKYFENNVANSISLFASMSEAGVRKIVFSSSCATYGLPDYVPLNEQHPQKPINVYGLTKLMIEQVLASLCRTLGWSAICLRYFNAAGASLDSVIGESHTPETHLVPLVLKAAKGSVPSVEINGTDYDTRDGTCVRDYIHVDDLAEAHMAAVTYLNSLQGFLPMNLGTALGYSVLEIIDACKRITNKEISVIPRPRRPGDPPSLIADYAQSQKELGWVPNYDLDTIIESAWNWEKQRRY